ncbi:MAG: acyl-CoA carboxylase subunit beta, partial [Acidobacteria bacterium]|nr:acyl-CoA carboxylase subunit beta [Acidobacteriota bacterium]
MRRPVGALQLLQSNPNRVHLENLVRELRELEERLRLGGGVEKAERQRQLGKLPPRMRVEKLLDQDIRNRANFQEIGLLVAHDEYDGLAPSAGVITGIGIIAGREVVIVANDNTIKAGSWWPETIQKILRAQEIAMRCRVPIIYLVDSAGVNLPYQDRVYPGQYGAARIFYYNSIMRRYLKIPQIAAVMGQCVAGGAYLPALSDVILMVEGTSFMGLGGPNLVKGATGQKVDSETLGGAKMHNAISGVAHYRSKNDEECIDKIREIISELPGRPPTSANIVEPGEPLRPTTDLYDIIPADHRAPYDAQAMLDCILDRDSFNEFQADYAKEMIVGHARVCGIGLGIVANNRSQVPNVPGKPHKIGGIIYSESSEKTAYFIETCNRQGTPLLFIQDVSGFMVGVDAEQSGIIRAGARFVEAMATSTVPKIVLTVNHASGAGYYAMAGQGFDPDFIFTLPTGRMGVMEGESAVMALFAAQLDKLKEEGKEP